MKAEHQIIALLLARCEELEQKLKVDALTGAMSQSALVERWHQEDEVTIIAVDVAGLKAVNELQGHDQGDLLLRKVAFDLKECVRLTDCVYRRGGDEFVIILPHCGYHDADKVEARVRALPYSLYIGVVSGNQKLSILMQAAFSQVEQQKIARRKND